MFGRLWIGSLADWGIVAALHQSAYPVPAIRCRRFEAIANERYDFFDKEKMKGDFLASFKKLADKKNSKWQHVYMHFRNFTQGKCTFGEINVDLCNRFREYLLTVPQGLHKNRKLHINSAAIYWSTFRASIHTAYRDRKIKENPNGFLERIETMPTDKEHLSQDEVIRLASTPCSAPALKRVFLFSCLTALRLRDIQELTYPFYFINPPIFFSLFLCCMMKLPGIIDIRVLR